ncbi:hypothetical protein [Acerihabitans arboris]|uniref:Uncharacterized protein n=1 Tax=Acerihabitans arboris TaxID=2691583 RepID=A0A845SEY2_9GAMM|nr:hypothetical protein [Acerihabitans arboris]NDL61646.1 hypothetical protein [Acerihabitans arboris]
MAIAVVLKTVHASWRGLSVAAFILSGVANALGAAGETCCGGIDQP